jgi:hypothetical protein
VSLVREDLWLDLRRSTNIAHLTSPRPHPTRYRVLFPHPAGYPMLYATRDYLVKRLEEFGFKVTPAFDAASGMTYEISGTAGDD